MATTPNTTIPSRLDPQQQAAFDSSTSQGPTKQAIGGLPSDYVATHPGFNIGPEQGTGDVDRGWSAQQKTPIQYWEGDQYIGFSGRDPQDILKLQLELKDVGLFPKSYRPHGVWDAASQQGMEQLMTYANQRGTTWEDILQQWKQFTPDAEQQTGAVLTVKSADDIASVLKATSAKVLGRGLSQAEVDQLVAGYQNIDRSAQEAKAAASATVAAGQTSNETVVDAPSLATYAEDRLRQSSPGEAHWYEAHNRMKEFYSLLGERNVG